MDIPTPTTTKKKNRGFWTIPLLLGLIAALLIRSFFVSLVRVDGSSMVPNLQNNELVFSWRMAEIKRGSIVVFDALNEDPSISDSGSTTYIKRVIGLPGDTVEYRNGNLYVNGAQVNQKWISKDEQIATSMGMDEASGWSLGSLSLSLNWPDKDRNQMKVPKNSYFVLGDNRSISKDSRQFGFVDKNNVIGVATLPFWSGNTKTKANINDAWKNFFIPEDKTSSSSSSSEPEPEESSSEETPEEEVQDEEPEVETEEPTENIEE